MYTVAKFTENPNTTKYELCSLYIIQNEKLFSGEISKASIIFTYFCIFWALYSFVYFIFFIMQFLYMLYIYVYLLLIHYILYF